MSANLVAIDFETANECPSSACALGIALIEDNKIKTVKQWLIKPPEMRFLPFNSYLHKITEKDVEKKPEFYRIWPSVKKYLEGNIIIAHNADFDMGVLRSVLRVYQLDLPELSYFCTVALSRKVWKGFKNYKLNTIAAELDIEFNHHKAGEDAFVCASIALRASEKLEILDFNEILKKMEMKICKFEDII